MIDVTCESAVQLNSAGDTANVGAGARLVDVYSTLGAAGVALPGGSCPTVGIVGLTLGGGLGVVDRRFGLTCDNLLGATVVLASGQVVTCSAQEESDLFWALQRRRRWKLRRSHGLHLPGPPDREPPRTFHIGMAME